MDAQLHPVEPLVVGLTALAQVRALGRRRLRYGLRLGRWRHLGMQRQTRNKRRRDIPDNSSNLSPVFSPSVIRVGQIAPPERAARRPQQARLRCTRYVEASQHSFCSAIARKRQGAPVMTWWQAQWRAARRALVTVPRRLDASGERRRDSPSKHQLRHGEPMISRRQILQGGLAATSLPLLASLADRACRSR